MIISINYISKWQIKNATHYKWTTCKKLVNTRTGKEIMKTKFGNSNKVGYYINGSFVKCEDLKNMIELIPKDNYCPF